MRPLPARTGGVYAFPVTTTPITDSNQETLDLIAEAVHRMSHQLDQMHKDWQELRPLIEAYQRGGPLGFRTALRQRKGT